MINQKGQELVIDPTDYPIGDRTSNGSFAMDEKRGGEVIKVIDSPEISIDDKLLWYFYKRVICINTDNPLISRLLIKYYRYCKKI